MRRALGAGLVGTVVVCLTVLAATPVAASVQLSATTVDFGEVPIGTTASLSVTVTNVGATPFGPLQMAGGAPFTAEFSGSQSCAGNTLPPGGTCAMTYTYTPTSVGAHTDESRFSIGLTTNQADQMQFAVELRGTGIDPTATTTTTTSTTTPPPTMTAPPSTMAPRPSTTEANDEGQAEDMPLATTTSTSEPVVATADLVAAGEDGSDDSAVRTWLIAALAVAVAALIGTVAFTVGRSSGARPPGPPSAPPA